MGNPSKQQLIRHLQWDTDFWALPVANLVDANLHPENSQFVFDWCRQEKIRCLYFLANGADSQSLQCAYNLGFQFVDVRVEMEYDLSNVNQTEVPSLRIKSVSKKRELSIIKLLARKSHTDSRFFKDLNFNRTKCEELYEKWIDRDFDKGNILGFFPDEREIVKGYITLTMQSFDVARIGLIAVENDYRGLGVGSELLMKTISLSKKLKAKKLLVATQATNTSALRLYQKAGFRISDVKIWFHKWFA